MASEAMALAAQATGGVKQAVVGSYGRSLIVSGGESSSANVVMTMTRLGFKSLQAMRARDGRGKNALEARQGRVACSPVSTRAVAMQDSLTGMDEDSEGIDDLGIGQRELRQYPPGLQRYETMAVLRPDITEEQRLALTQRYEEAIIAGGGLDVEIFNRGMQPLAYNIKTKNMGGLSSRYLDGIYFLFTYVTKPESQITLQKKLNADDDIIRSTTFRLKV